MSFNLLINYWVCRRYRYVAVQVQQIPILLYQIVSFQLPLALNKHHPTLLKPKTKRLEDEPRLVRHLKFTQHIIIIYPIQQIIKYSFFQKSYLHTTKFASALHPRSHINSIAPYVVVWFPGANNTGRYRPMINAHFQYKVIEALLVDVGQRLLHFEGKVHEGAQVVPSGPLLLLRGLGDTGGCHVRRANCFYFNQALELLAIEDL